MSLDVRADVHTLITLRSAARAVIAVARTVATGADFWYAFVVEDVALIEQVAADGIHRFALLHHREVAAALVAAVVHPDTGDAAGEPVTLTTPGDPAAAQPILDRLGGAFVRCDLVVRTVEDERPVLLGVFTGPAGAWLFRSTYGSAGPVRAEPHSAEAIRSAITETAAKALAATGRPSHVEQATAKPPPGEE